MRLGRLVPASLSFALALGACSGLATPTPTPAEFGDLISALVLRGITVRGHVSGDPGCPGSILHSNAVRLDLALSDDPTIYPAYVFRWRRTADFDAAASTFGECVDEYVSLHPDASVEGLEVAPWRTYGPGWPDRLSTALAEALGEAGGGPAATISA